MKIHSISKRPLKSFINAGVAAIVLLSACSLLPLTGLKNIQIVFYTVMLIAIVAGAIHLKYLDKIFDTSSDNTFGVCLFFTMLPVLASLLLSAVIYYFFSIPYQFLTFQTGFVVPFLINQAYTTFLSIPEGKYKTWSYPYYDQSPKTDGIDHSVTELVNLVLSKEPNATTQTSFKLDAPVNMPFGALFFNFINEYNKANTEKEIIYADENSKRYGWTFFRKSGLLMQKDYIDPEATFLQNGIRKNEIIYAARELPQGEETADYVDADATKNSVPSNF